MAQALNIFKFLKEYNQIKNPVVRELRSQIWHKCLNDIPEIKEIKSIYKSKLEDGTILSVVKPKLQACPDPGEDMYEWIIGAWRRLNIANIEFKPELDRQELKDGELIEWIEKFEDDPARKIKFDEWVRSREEWRKKELPKSKGLDLYNDLFKLYSDIKKE